MKLQGVIQGQEEEIIMTLNSQTSDTVKLGWGWGEGETNS